MAAASDETEGLGSVEADSAPQPSVQALGQRGQRKPSFSAVQPERQGQWTVRLYILLYTTVYINIYIL